MSLRTFHLRVLPSGSAIITCLQADKFSSIFISFSFDVRDCSLFVTSKEKTVFESSGHICNSMFSQHNRPFGACQSDQKGVPFFSGYKSLRREKSSFLMMTAAQKDVANVWEERNLTLALFTTRRAPVFRFWLFNCSVGFFKISQFLEPCLSVKPASQTLSLGGIRLCSGRDRIRESFPLQGKEAGDTDKLGTSKKKIHVHWNLFSHW